MVRSIIFVVVVGILFGCASPPKTPADKVNEVVELMKVNAAKSDFDRFYANLVDLYKLPLGAAQVQRFFAENPAFVSPYRLALQKDIEEARSIFLLQSYLRMAEQLTASGIFNQDQIVAIRKQAGQVAVRNNMSSYFEIMHGDGAESIDALREPLQLKIITDRTIDKIKQTVSGTRPIDPLMRYLAGLDPSDTELRRVEAVLPSLNLRRSELPFVQGVYPNYVKQRMNELSVQVYLHFKNIDRLTSDDMKAGLKNDFAAVDWIGSAKPNAIEIGIEKVRHDERTIPPKTETITYSYHQVDVLNAVLFMPKNASYLYDYSTEGAEIDFGYVVTVKQNGQAKSEEVVRGKLGGEGGKCQNARIQNVFGGVSAANFPANDHMRSKCSAAAPMQLSEMRDDVMRRVFAAIGRVPEIAATSQ